MYISYIQHSQCDIAIYDLPLEMDWIVGYGSVDADDRLIIMPRCKNPKKMLGIDNIDRLYRCIQISDFPDIIKKST